MATITKTRSKLRQFGAAPFGNTSTLYFQVKTNASGALIDSDSIAAIASGDKLDLGPLPAGMSLDDVTVTISTVMTASVTTIALPTRSTCARMPGSSGSNEKIFEAQAREPTAASAAISACVAGLITTISAR